MTTPALQRPGGRTQRNQDAVHESVLDLLRTTGPDFTYAELAERSGVSRRTLHRRWPNRGDLISDALTSNYGQFDVELTGDLPRDLLEFALRFRDFSARPTTILVDGLAALAPDAGFARLSLESFDKSTTAMRTILDNASREALTVDPAHIDALLLMLMSPISVSSSILRTPMSDADVNELVLLVLRAMRPAATSTATGQHPE